MLLLGRGRPAGPDAALRLSVARIAALGALLWTVARQEAPGLHGAHLATTLLMVAAALGWAGWLAGRHFRAPEAVPWAGLCLMAATGGALAGLAPVALTFPAVAGLGAGIAFEAGPATAVGAAGTAALLVSGLSTGQPVGFLVEGALAVLAGLMAGASRRQYTRRAGQAEALLDERVRADSERDRAAALAERNRIGREIHDVLAHSLGALAVQLDAADALLDNPTTGDAGGTRARELVRNARRLAVQGLEETRQAVHALRDEPVALTEQLGALVVHDGASLSVVGAAHPLAAEAGGALYRAAQEALTNARKHAPGALVSVRLEFGPECTVLTVTNGAPPSANGDHDLALTGGGYGLQGMRERVELLGGHFRAAPDGEGYTVEVRVPA